MVLQRQMLDIASLIKRDRDNYKNTSNKLVRDATLKCKHMRLLITCEVKTNEW